MSTDRQDPDQRRGENPPERQDPAADDASETGGEGGTESYGGDPDAGPSVTEEEVQTGMDRDQAEG
jgi:hypothetical protein